jgi:hypothetical protein
MVDPTSGTNQSKSHPQSVPRAPLSKRIALAATFGALILFPDLFAHLVLQVFHVALGWLHLAIEHGLQSAFDVSRHTAQIITAWIGLGALIALSVWLYRATGPRLRKIGAQGRRFLKKPWAKLPHRIGGLTLRTSHFKRPSPPQRG